MTARDLEKWATDGPDRAGWEVTKRALEYRDANPAQAHEILRDIEVAKEREQRLETLSWHYERHGMSKASALREAATEIDNAAKAQAEAEDEASRAAAWRAVRNDF
jgi:hypothetical protein